MGEVHRVPALQQYLLVLVLVPILGLAALGGVTVHDRLQRRDQAQAALEHVRAAAVLESLRGAVAREMVPMMGYALFTQGNVYRRFGLTAEDVATMSSSRTSRQLLAEAQATTDTAVLRAQSGATLKVGRAAARSLQHARRATAADASSGFPRYRELLDMLTAAGADELDAAAEIGLDPSVSEPLAQLQSLSRTSALADMTTSSYLDSVSNPASRVDFVQTWGAYRLADRAVRDSAAAVDGRAAGATDVVRAAWNRLDTSIAVRRSEERLAEAATTGSRPTVSDFTVLASGGVQRDRLMHGALDEAVDEVEAAARAQSLEASEQLHRLLVLAVGVITASLLLACFVRRAIARPLGHLARQARTIASGELVDLDERGPREVRVVAQGLSATVSSLRLIRDQAEAIATGDLDREVLARQAPGALGEYMHVSITQMIDVLRRKEQFQSELAHQAAHDSLTRLPNRAQALTLTDQALHRAARTQARVALLFIDLDHFKAVNDTFGHAAGDEVLRVTADRMLDTVRGGDVVARLGGDEFVVLIEGAEDERGLVDLGRRLIDRIGVPVDVDHVVGPCPRSAARGGSPGPSTAVIGASIGIAFAPAGGEPDGSSAEGADGPDVAAWDAADLLRRADTAAYAAKAAGRGVVRTYRVSMTDVFSRG